MRPYGLAPAGAAAPAARMVMSIWRCSLLDQYFELETGSRGAARSPPCAPETGGQPVNFHVTDCVSESEIGLPLWSFAGVKRTLDRKRSEEHTSELQSLMRISYAVLCWTQKIKQTTHKQELRKIQN